MGQLKAFFRFWYDFVIGDDWRVAAGVTAALALTYGIARAGVPSWWVLPIGVGGLLPASVWQAARRKR